jgi:hypothetical protein
MRLVHSLRVLGVDVDVGLGLEVDLGFGCGLRGRGGDVEKLCCCDAGCLGGGVDPGSTE